MSENVYFGLMCPDHPDQPAIHCSCDTAQAALDHANHDDHRDHQHDGGDQHRGRGDDQLHHRDDDRDPGPDPEPGDDEQDVAPRFHVVTFADFANVEEPGAQALLGTTEEMLIPQGADCMFYGDGGAGKTTLSIDLGFHLAAGDDWLGITVAQPVTVLFIEDEGPRPPFRRKIKTKLDAWTGSTIKEDQLTILDEPWGRFTLAIPEHRWALADHIAEHQVDLVFLGPLVCAGMEAAGTLQDTREFAMLLNMVRRRSGRQITFVLIHHENRSGKVSGAWEGTGDTLLHVTGMGHGHTRLHIQKARWASDYQASTLTLAWTEGAGFEVEEKPEITDGDIAEQILEHVRRDQGIGWSKVEKAITGVRRERKMAMRDLLLRDGWLVNIVRSKGADAVLTECLQGKQTHLHTVNDPAIQQLLPEPGRSGGEASPAWGDGAPSATSPLLPVRSRGEVRGEVEERGHPAESEPDDEPFQALCSQGYSGAEHPGLCACNELADS